MAAPAAQVRSSARAPPPAACCSRGNHFAFKVAVRPVLSIPAASRIQSTFGGAIRSDHRHFAYKVLFRDTGRRRLRNNDAVAPQSIESTSARPVDSPQLAELDHARRTRPRSPNAAARRRRPSSPNGAARRTPSKDSQRVRQRLVASPKTGFIGALRLQRVKYFR